MKVRSLIIALSCISVTGCSTMFRAIQEDPVRKETLTRSVQGVDDEVMGTLSLSADRRTVLVRLGNGPQKGGFCAEPPPDIANEIKDVIEGKANLKAENKASQTSEEGGVEGKAEYESEVIQLGERTVFLDIYRTGTYSLCQYHLNGAVSVKELPALYQELTKRVIDGIVESQKNE